jgi:N-acetylglucosaminyldiphosphoundecaprenol N-acetyl-beta-D-mannosaminyltransferase
MPLVWGLRLAGSRGASRVYGPDLTPLILRAAEREGFGVAFYGGTRDALERLLIVVRARFPELKVAYASSPPFRRPTATENQQTACDINASGAGIVLVGLSTPKQEFWMAGQKGSLRAPMIGVGAAFDFLAGMKPQAPRWMMRIGMEWFFRLVTEPRRLWKRYLKHNPRFVMLFALQLLGLKKFPGRVGVENLTQ